MEARHAQLEALIMNMAAQVKSTTFEPKKAKDKKDGQLYGSRILLWNWFFGINGTI
jgi:hypothetical protein